MNIQEIKLDKHITVSKFNFTCDEKVDGIPAPLPNILNFFMLIVGRPGSGKSNLLLNLLCKKGKCFNKRFDKVYVFSPSLLTMKDSPFECIPDDQVFDELNVDSLESVLSKIKESGEKVLFLLDDVVNDLNKSPELLRLMNKILMNRRHLAGSGGSVSVIMTAQVYNKVNLSIRKTATQVILFNTRNKKELNAIFEELILIKLKEFYSLLNYSFKSKHDFILIDLEKPISKMFYRNFNLLKFKSSNDDILSIES